MNQMKKLFGYIFLLIALLFPLAGRGAETTRSITAQDASNWNFLASPTYLTVVSVSAGNVGTLTVSVYDSDTTNSLIAIGSHVTRTSVAGYRTNIFTTTTGLSQTNIQYGLITSLSTNAASTNSLTPILTFSVSPNTTVDKIVDIRTARGVLVKPGTNATVSITYR